MERFKIIGIMGSGSEEHPEQAEPLATWIAEQGHHLLTGGGNGVMLAASRAFCQVPDRRGKCIGIIPSSNGQTKTGYPNAHVEIPIVTHLPLSGEDGMGMQSRNHINVLTADILVALPGGWGTSSEVKLALHYQKPIIAWLPQGMEIPDLPKEVPVGKDLETVINFIKETAPRV